MSDREFPPLPPGYGEGKPCLCCHEAPQVDDGVYGTGWCEDCLHMVSATGGCDEQDHVKHRLRRLR